MSAVQVEYWKSLRTYLQTMRRFIRSWEHFLQTNEIMWLTPEELLEWTVRLTHTLNVLEQTYVYDTFRSLQVLREDSGFPERREIELLTQVLPDDAQDPRVLKNQFLDSVLTKADTNVAALEKIAKARAYQMRSQNNLHQPFWLSGISERHSPQKGRRAFVCHWERYTVTPAKYVMLFEASGDWTPDKKNLSELADILRDASTHLIGMDRIAASIDIASCYIHPKWVGRVVLGPVWIGDFTRSTHAFQRVVDVVDSSDDGFAGRLIHECVLSEEELEMTHVRDARGRSHQFIQRFVVRDDYDYAKRGTTRFEEFFFATHAVIQSMDPEHRKEIGHQLKEMEE